MWYSWGSGGTGALAHNNTQDFHTPTLITHTPFTQAHTQTADQVISLSCSGVRTLCLTAAGQVWTCGKDTVAAQSSCVPRQLFSFKDRVKTLACGWTHCAAITVNDELFVWGDNRHHQCCSTEESVVLHPRQLSLSSSSAAASSFLSVACGWKHTLAVSSQYGLYGWGSNRAGQLGREDRADISIPTEVSLDNVEATDYVILVHCGWQFSTVITQGGSVYCTGSNKYQQCGIDEKETNTLTEFTLLASLSALTNTTRIIDVACGWSHVLSLTSTGRLIAWGRADLGQQGCRPEQPLKPYLAPHVIDMRSSCKAIACGSESCLAIDENGQVWSWGWNEHGNIGCGSIESNVVWTPTIVPVKAGEHTEVDYISAGGAAVFARITQVE